MEIEDTSMYAGVIYGLHTGDFDYRYIGQTIQTVRDRFNQHKKYAMRGDKGSPVYNWIRKHGEDGIQVCVIETFDQEHVHLMDQREEFYIAQYCDISEGKNMNSMLKARGTGAMSDEQKKKISVAHKGRKFTDEHKANIKESWETRSPVTDETRAKQSANTSGAGNPNYGKTTSEAAKEKSRYTRHKNSHPASNWSKANCRYCIEESNTDEKD